MTMKQTSVTGGSLGVVDVATLPGTVEVDINASKVSLDLLDDAISTTGTAVPTKSNQISGTDGTNARVLKTDASGELQVDVLSSALPTGAATEVTSATISGKLPATLGQKVDSASLAVTLSTEGTAQLGSLTETAPATDTASSGLNGRMQRVAQRLSSLISLFPTSLGSKADASSFAVTHSTEDKALLGALTETAPATDTASSGLNGRLQRIAQRLSSLIGLFPTSLGSKADASSLAVTHSTEDKALLGALTETAPATDTASSGLNGRLQRVSQRITSLIALLPASLGSKADDSSFAVTHSTEDKALLGALTETSPATDTASSGLNGRLQRVAQRITSLIALIPASLGQKTMANSFAVTVASDQTAVATKSPVNATATFSEDTTVGNGAAESFSAPANAVGFILQASNANVGNIRWKCGGTATTTSGHQLEPGRDTGIIPIAANISYINESTTGDYLCVTWLAP